MGGYQPFDEERQIQRVGRREGRRRKGVGGEEEGEEGWKERGKGESERWGKEKKEHEIDKWRIFL